MSHSTEDRQSSPARTASHADPLDAHARARRLAALDLDAHLSDPSRKQAFVTPMFDVIAPRYDAFTRLFSFGMDAGWKRSAIAVVAAHLGQLGEDRQRCVVDVACGTGDLAVGVVRGAEHHVFAIGVDASFAMAQRAMQRVRQGERAVSDRVRVVTGDMCSLPLPDGSADVMTAGYGVRNAPDPLLAIREAARVLRVGGLYVTLDFYRPRVAPWRALLLGYLFLAGNAVGWAWHRTPVVYGYIARSIDHFMSWQDFSLALQSNGFRVRTVRRWLGGGVALHVAERV